MMFGADPALSQAQRTRLFHRAIAATGTGVVIVDLRLPDQPIVFVNPAFLQLTGYQADEALGRVNGQCEVPAGGHKSPHPTGLIRPRESGHLLRGCGPRACGTTRPL